MRAEALTGTLHFFINNMKELISSSYKDMLGIEPKPIKISKLEDVLDGAELERMLSILADNKKHRKEHPWEDGGCHYNSGMMMFETLEDWDITFAEGLVNIINNIWISHCWTCLTNKNTGEKRYVDVTLNEELDAKLFAEWGWDIIDLFDETGMAMVPHLWVGMYPEHVDYFAEYYPSLKKESVD